MVTKELSKKLENNKKKKNMWFGIFLVVCSTIAVYGVVQSDEFKELIDNVEE